MRPATSGRQGWVYLTNFDEPYLLWLPALLLGAGLILMTTRSRPWWIRREPPHGYGRLARMVQSPPAVVLFIVVSGLLQAFYWIRQGGDFMHGRVLLTPMFCLLAPVAVIPVLLPDGEKFSRGVGYQLAGITSCSGSRSSAGRCGRPTHRGWVRTPPA